MVIAGCLPSVNDGWGHAQHTSDHRAHNGRRTHNPNHRPKSPTNQLPIIIIRRTPQRTVNPLPPITSRNHTRIQSSRQPRLRHHRRREPILSVDPRRECRECRLGQEDECEPWCGDRHGTSPLRAFYGDDVKRAA